MDVSTFYLNMKLFYDRMILLWPKNQTVYRADQAKAIAGNMVDAAAQLLAQLDAYRNNFSSDGKLTIMNQYINGTKRAQSPLVSIASMEGGAKDTIDLPNLRAQCIDLAKQLWLAADGLRYVKSVDDEYGFMATVADRAARVLEIVEHLANVIAKVADKVLHPLKNLEFWLIPATIVGAYWWIRRK